MHELINLLQRRQLLWQGSPPTQSASVHASKYPELDKMLHGGFPSHGVIDIHTPVGIGELRLLLPYLRQQQKLLVFINPPGLLCAEMLFHYGIAPEQVLVISSEHTSHPLWAAEQCLKSGCCTSVLLWHQQIDIQHVKRLQLASEQSQGVVLLMREMASVNSLPVNLGLTLAPTDNGLNITIRKHRGHWPKPAFNVSMRQQWSALFPVRQDNVVPFVARQEAAQ